MTYLTIVLPALIIGFANAFAGVSNFAGSSVFSNVQSTASRGKALQMNINERTYIMIKPDGVQRGLVGNIISRFENRGFKLQAMKTRMATKEILDTHYEDLVERPFFPDLREYMLSGPVCCMVWEGKEAVSTGRKMLGATNPLDSAPGTIRGDFCLITGRNICHGSDSGKLHAAIEYSFLYLRQYLIFS
uniref:nucleoside-diphosphate kinase n=2 Tax=Corethron hystrix TaxID=216773 RepID=A0A7S1FYL2_9STRA|mmetsp:Transcript_39323/g.91789  ORF Transcript_39323/g.91789 Transcript_39323/m.91789 type:complete len:189 (+) Transcript_39323:163-729(+)